DDIINENPSLAAKIADALKTAKENVKGAVASPYKSRLGTALTYGQLNRAEQLWNAALRESARNNIGTTDSGKVKSAAEGQTAADSGEVRYSVQQNSKGKYVQADRQVIKSNNPNDWEGEIYDYINNAIRQGKDVVIPTDDGDSLTINEKTAWKMGYRNEVKNADGTSRYMTDDEYRTKINAAANIDELAQISKRGKKNVADKKNHGFAQNGFNYRTAYFRDFDGQYYRMTISVGENSNQKTVYNIGKIERASFPAFSGSKTSGKATSAKRNSYKETISDSGENVKYSAKENSESDAKELVNKWRDHNYDVTRTDYYEPLIDLIYDRAAKTSAEYEGYFVTDMQEELGYEAERMLDPIIRAAFRNPEQIPDTSDQKTYYRIGDLRTNGYSGYMPSQNFATGNDELGVSVISSEWLNNLKSIFFGLSDEKIAERGVYEVVGFEVAKGGDGEPLIFVTEEPRFRDDIDTVEELIKEVEWEENNNSDVRFSMKEGADESAGTGVEDLSTEENTERFVQNVDKVFSGEMPTGNIIKIGNTPSILQDYGASDLPITINQSTMYKIAYPTGYFGAEKQGHNLGISALKQLPKQIADPMAILKSNSQDNSLILLTEWEDTEGNPVIVPLHLDKDGAIGFSNEVASAYGKGNIDAILTDEDGKSTVKYTKNNEDIHQLLSAGLQLPGAAADDTLINYNIPDDAEKVKYSMKENPESDKGVSFEDEAEAAENTEAYSEESWKSLEESEPSNAQPKENTALKALMEEKGVNSASELMPNTVT
ncbi:MAG: hypothetical protein LIO59_07280, partial [Oscillospiraceae bacterium]|nr:hypothetical protein [Oscillospiraceae bacterium]